MVIFHSYVSLPEGKSHLVGVNSPSANIAGNIAEIQMIRWLGF